MVDRTLTSKEQGEILGIISLLTGYVSKIAMISDPLVCLALRAACARATDLMIDFEPNELKRARLRKEIEESQAKCDCPSCTAAKKLDS